MRVHRACGAEGQCLESCSCLDSASWKLAPTSAWNGMFTESCGDAAPSAVALVDSGATHSFVSAALVSKLSLPVKPGGDMEVTLADGNQVKVSQTCCVPLVVCSGALHCTINCRVLPQLNHDVVLGVDWLQATNPSIDW